MKKDDANKSVKKPTSLEERFLMMDKFALMWLTGRFAMSLVLKMEKAAKDESEKGV